MLISVQWLSLVSNKFTDTQFFENSAAKSEAEGLIGRTDYSPHFSKILIIPS